LALGCGTIVPPAVNETEGGPSSVRATSATQPAWRECYKVTRNSRSGKRLFHAGFTIGGEIVSRFFRRNTNPNRSAEMPTPANFRMTLTPEQKEQVRKATGKEAEVIELSVEELEERIAPMVRKVYPA
jgi:hypothetical protein